MDGVFTLIEDVKPLEKNNKHSIDIVVDRIVVKPENRARIYESIETALDWSKGLLVIYSDIEEKVLSDRHTCPICGFSVPKLEPRLFSFNAPMGFCPDCKGLGIKREAAPELLVPNPKLSISKGALEYYKKTGRKISELPRTGFTARTLTSLPTITVLTSTFSERNHYSRY